MGGDLLITRQLCAALDSGTLEPLAAILSSCDVAIANLETLFHDFEYPASASSGGTWLQCPPQVAGELKQLGFHIVARANNHALDYGLSALRQTSDTLAQAGIAHGGVGEGLYDALRPCLVDTVNGRVALISVTSTLPTGSAASRGTRGTVPRPGVAPLRFKTTHWVPPDDWLTLEKMAAKFGGASTSGALKIGGAMFRSGDSYLVTTEPDLEDLREIEAVVTESGRIADKTIVSIHCHESGGELERPPEFLRNAAQRIAIAGADIVFGHGPHIIRGVEVQAGVPILYSLGNLFLQNDMIPFYPDDARRKINLPVGSSDELVETNKASLSEIDSIWETVVSVVEFGDGGTIHVDFHPFVLSQEGHKSARGVPISAGQERGNQILTRLSSLSREMGTKIGVARTSARLRI